MFCTRRDAASTHYMNNASAEIHLIHKMETCLRVLKNIESKSVYSRDILWLLYTCVYVYLCVGGKSAHKFEIG